MHTIIDTLMHEHRVIEQVLTALEAAAANVNAGGELERARVAEFATFFAGFADHCHHGKEEDLLFTAMVEAGFPRGQGPIGVMLAEHEENRVHVGALAAIGRGSGPLTPADRTAFAAHVAAFVPMLRQHIIKEDQVLYPMALRALAPARLNRMVQEFDSFEASVIGPGEHERLHALADVLVAAYPEPNRAPAPVCHHHHHHDHA